MRAEEGGVNTEQGQEFGMPEASAATFVSRGHVAEYCEQDEDLCGKCMLRNSMVKTPMA